MPEECKKHFPSKCTCGKTLDESDVKYLDTNDLCGVTHWFNCLSCNTTLIKSEEEDGIK